MKTFNSEEAILDFLRFMEHSSSPYHAARELSHRFAHCGFMPLSLKEPWSLQKGERYFVEEGGAVFAFSLPSEQIEKAIVVASHTDSPALMLKPHPQKNRDQLLFYKTEVYGSPILRSYLDRDLLLSGIVITKQGTKELVSFEEFPCIIPSPAIHLDQKEEINPELHLLPLIGLDKWPLDFHDFLSFDLFLTPMDPPRRFGKSRELIASCRIDNLASAYAGMVALVHSTSKNHLMIYAAFNHEEIGSSTDVGASSPLFQEIFSRIASSLHLNQEEKYATLHKSLCISCDMAQGFHPLYENAFDPQNTPHLGKGVALKVNAKRRYSSHAATLAPLVEVAHRHNLPLQYYAARADKRSGSTIGSLHATATGMATVDIGAPQLAMHAAREVMATQDFIDLCYLLGHSLEECRGPF